MTYSTFEQIDTRSISSLHLDVSEYRHRETGARHFHLAAEDNNNAFMVAFLTVPQDSSGVAHILEHTSLCGSEQFPVRDPFFMMTRRSLNTFMNAFTSSDWTAYPFASQNAKDFDNLLRVYLDAVFFPRLDPLDFSQEGHRVEFEEADNPDSDLVFKGVVFNEMKGAMSAPTSKLWHLMHENIYTTTTYHYNSGGEPENIPDLTYEELKAFHARHYHPSNAVFLTYGDADPEQHQRRFEENALARFKREEMDLSIPDEKRFSAPLAVQQPYPLDGDEDTSGKTHILLGWLLGQSADLDGILRSHLLSSVLLDNSASPMRQALETSDLGNAPSDLCGLDDSTREASFMCGMEGSDPEKADQVEALIMGVLQDVAENGVPQEMVEAVLHQLELSQREITGGSFPYGLRMMVNALPPILYGGDPVAVLDMEKSLEKLRKDIQDPQFIKTLARERLLENPHRVRLVMHPDKQLSAHMLEQEKQRLAAIKSGLSDADKQRIVQLAHDLEARQNQIDDPSSLPKVGLEDVPDDIRISEGSSADLNGMPVTLFDQGTNGLVYAKLVVDLPDLDPALQDLLPIYSDCLTEIGAGDKDYLAMQSWQAAVTGGVHAHVSLRSSIDDLHKTRGVFVLSGKALARNTDGLADVLAEVFEQARFDELDRIRELIAQSRAHQEASVTGHGHSLAMTAASSGISPMAGISHRWSGLAAIHTTKQLDEAIKDDARMAELAGQLQAIHAAVQAGTRQMLLVCEGQRSEEVKNSFARSWQALASRPVKPSSFKPGDEQHQVQEGWAVNTQVNFCSRAYAAVPVEHADAPALTVLGRFLTNGFLHRAVREQGGAYGGGASYDSDAGAFRFYSYRDPRLAGTLDDFDASMAWLQENPHEARQLEEAVLSVIGAIDRPESPAGEASKTFFGNLHGRSPEQRKAYRKRILAVTLDDLLRVGAAYLKPESAHTAVISDPATLEEQAEKLGLEVRNL